jgi:putative addiction module component (TIGR02574 family)
MIDIDSLSRDEKLDLLERLWDSLDLTKDELPVPEWQIALAEERLADYRRDPTRARSAFEMLDELERRVR